MDINKIQIDIQDYIKTRNEYINITKKEIRIQKRMIWFQRLFKFILNNIICIFG
jgi:hypothetical protein